MIWWTKIKSFVTKYWQLLVVSVIALVFFFLGRSGNTKEEEVQLAKISKDLEKKKTQEVLEGWKVKQQEKDTSSVENLLQFEEKKAKILRDANAVDTEEFLASKGIGKEE